jgi:hypothetical protein
MRYVAVFVAGFLTAVAVVVLADDTPLQVRQ